MSLSVVSQQTQTKEPKTSRRTESGSLVESAEDHIRAATRITDVEDMRHFNMREMQEVRINLHLALELLALSKNQSPLTREGDEKR